MQNIDIERIKKQLELLTLCNSILRKILILDLQSIAICEKTSEVEFENYLKTLQKKTK